MPKFPSDLEKHPLFKKSSNVEAPVSVGLKNLMATKGPKLEIMANVTSKEMVNAIFIGYIYGNVYGSRYVFGRVEQVERVSKAKDALTCNQNISMVEAGGNLPAEYYNPAGQNRRWSPIGIAQAGGSDEDSQE